MTTAAVNYTTKAGDTVDWIVWRVYGSTSRGTVEKVLEQNRGLADMGSILPEGITITLPAAEPATEKRVRLWG